MENNTPPSVRYNIKKVANRARGKRPIDPNKVKTSWDNAKHEVFIRICLDEMRFGSKPALQSQTGLGFNEVTETYNMPREWWIEFFKGHLGAEKFQTQPLYFEEEFAAKGDDSWVPTSGSSTRGKRSFGWSDYTTVEDQEDYQPSEYQPYNTPTPNSIPPHPMSLIGPLAPVDRTLYPRSLLLLRDREPQ
ncbi:hypothetical protein QJS10_CPA03g01541 [Acorus calamus]|uniref:Uncharacterized protein n=1 Tax=Acorus calamus TaxID=4465 RepID=A0AAV9F7Z1_ACOCL|nr:hypothetical protein QJS10_CPA03g01541 [Acorus calamus]